MFRHLKPEDFVNLMEGMEPSLQQRNHLESCSRCRSTWHSLESVHSEVTSLHDEIPEPDWAEFRATVRDQLLSRSIQRESAVRRWTGWAIRPAVAWALSLLLAVGITTGVFLWNAEKTPEPGAPPPAVEPLTVEFIDVESYPALYSQTDLFEELVQLGDQEQEQLRQLLESSVK